MDKAITHLQKAIEIDPAYLEAYNNLGARYINARQYDKALGQFQMAHSLDEGSAVVCSNLAIAYLLLNRFPEAESWARAAIKIDSTTSKPRYVLGLALTAQRRDGQEALESLEAASRQFPTAHLAAAQVLERMGNRAAAAAELRKYLASGSVESKPKVEAWLADLEQQANSSAPRS